MGIIYIIIGYTNAVLYRWGKAKYISWSRSLHARKLNHHEVHDTATGLTVTPFAYVQDSSEVGSPLKLAVVAT